MGNSLHMCFGGPKEGDDTSQRSPMQDGDERDAGAHGKKHKRLSLCADRPMPDDFVWGANLGTGAFAKVVHARVKSAAARAKLRLPADLRSITIEAFKRIEVKEGQQVCVAGDPAD